MNKPDIRVKSVKAQRRMKNLLGRDICLDMDADDDVRLITNIIDKINPPAAITNESDRKQKIMDMAGKYDFCEEAVNELRIESMI